MLSRFKKRTRCFRHKFTFFYFITKTSFYQTTPHINQYLLSINNCWYQMCFTGRIGPNKINTHICCGRKLHPRYVNGSVQGCCRDKIYNQQKSICCNGVYYSDMNPGEKTAKVWKLSWQDKMFVWIFIYLFFVLFFNLKIFTAVVVHQHIGTLNKCAVV